MTAPTINSSKGGLPLMEHEPQQPIEQRHFRLTPEQQVHARREIETALDKLSEDEPVISKDTARIIAATIHTGAGSILEHFAATDRLNIAVAQKEVHEAIDRGDHPVWAMALLLYLENLDDPLPDIRPIEFDEPAPEVFLTSALTGRSAWIPLAGPPSSMDRRLQDFDPEWTETDVARCQLDRQDLSIGNVVGFHDVDVSTVPSVRSLLRLAQGIHMYGEGYAAYLSTFGIEGASRYTYQRLRVGTYDNLTALAASFVFTEGILSQDDVPGETRTRGQEIDLALFKQTLESYYRWHEGRNKLHLFARDTLGYGRPNPEQKDE